MILLKLFLSFLQIGAFSFGGGYAAMPLICHQVVELNKWLSMSEFSDLITISQMTPGPIAINAATFVGLKINGFLGAVIATLGCILPSCLIVSLIAYIYLKYRQLSIIQSILKYIRPAVVAMIGTSGLLIIISSCFGTTISLETLKLVPAGIFIIALYLLRVKRVNAITVMIISGVIQVVMGYFMKIFC